MWLPLLRLRTAADTNRSEELNVDMWLCAKLSAQTLRKKVEEESQGKIPRKKRTRLHASCNRLSAGMKGGASGPSSTDSLVVSANSSRLE